MRGVTQHKYDYECEHNLSISTNITWLWVWHGHDDMDVVMVLNMMLIWTWLWVWIWLWYGDDYLMNVIRRSWAFKVYLGFPRGRFGILKRRPSTLECYKKRIYGLEVELGGSLKIPKRWARILTWIWKRRT